MLMEDNGPTTEVDRNYFLAAYEKVNKEIATSKNASNCGGKPYFYGATKMCGENQYYVYQQVSFRNKNDMLELPKDFPHKLHYSNIVEELEHSGICSFDKGDYKGIAIKYTNEQKRELCIYDAAFGHYYHEYFFDVIDWDGKIKSVGVFKYIVGSGGKEYQDTIHNYATFKCYKFK